MDSNSLNPLNARLALLGYKVADPMPECDLTWRRRSVSLVKKGERFSFLLEGNTQEIPSWFDEEELAMRLAYDQWTA